MSESPSASPEPDFGKWVGGIMKPKEGGNDPIARNTMAARLVADGKNVFGTDCDLLVIAVPTGLGDAFMERFIEGVGENPKLRASVDL